MKYTIGILLFAFTFTLNCLSAGKGFQIKENSYSDLSGYKNQKIFIDLTYEYGKEKEKTKSDGKTEKTVERLYPELYVQFKDALYLELRGRYKLNIEKGAPKDRKSVFISVSPRMDNHGKYISETSIIFNKETDPLYKIDITNEYKSEIIVLVPSVTTPKTVEQLAEYVAKRINNAFLGIKETE